MDAQEPTPQRKSELTVLRRLLAAYTAADSGPVGLIGALINRAVEATRRAPEPWRRILWGQKR